MKNKQKARPHKYDDNHKTERCATIRNEALVKARDRKKRPITVFKARDLILPVIDFHKYSHGVKVEVEITEEDILVSIGPRDIQWDRRTGKVVATGTY